MGQAPPNHLCSGVKNGPHQEDKSIEPVYSVKENVTVKMMRRFIQQALTQYADSLPDPLPEKLRTSYKPPDYQQALKAMHQPETREALKLARRRFVYEEFLLFQLKMQAFRKAEREQTQGIRRCFSNEELMRFIKASRFLTNAQSRVLREITSDMSSPYRMNRLLQGDVGSGKRQSPPLRCMPRFCPDTRERSWCRQKFWPNSMLIRSFHYLKSGMSASPFDKLCQRKAAKRTA